MSILVTGGAGFIGSNFIRKWLDLFDEEVINLDKLTYAGNVENLSSINNAKNYILIHGDIVDRILIDKILNKYKPRFILNFAAETHVDRSIHGPSEFIQTNVVGTFNLLESTRKYWASILDSDKKSFRFLHVSTDEVYGSLGPNDNAFTEVSRYKPNSPYSASKASSDHLIRAYFFTYGLPVLTTNCSNNYGPYQFPEKLIPLIVLNALSKKNLPLYGDGSQIRDWLHVHDHCDAIIQVLEGGNIGEVYNVGGNSEKTNIDVVKYICEILDRVSPRDDGVLYSSQITFVKDRSGHDKRYAIDSSKIKKYLNWQPKETFETGIEKTVSWYVNNLNWVDSVSSKDHIDWLTKNYK
jgi:dTDP-glucose 4,6-dehydratase